jgi:hypothetical protein
LATILGLGRKKRSRLGGITCRVQGRRLKM